MPVVKNYTRADFLSDFGDSCASFAAGGELNGRSFDSLRATGAIDALWSYEIAELVDMGQIGKGALNWKPLSDTEKTALFDAADPLPLAQPEVQAVAATSAPRRRARP